VPDEEPDQSVKLQWRGSGGPGSKLVIEMLARASDFDTYVEAVAYGRLRSRVLTFVVPE
jgi:hypothetical protein